ncbi:MAG: 23S rRNA (uracil(1939)-C(5))-methyltransferase RlmD [Lachnospira sp.]|nr:23S rRNA (uracil(1939)-C(5))-methyltransferase RlmD [Lachnospira sp.]
MRKGDVLTGKVEYVSFPNKAYVRVDSDNPEDNGRMVVVKNSIPGQTVEFMINKKRGDKCEARLLQVLSTSPQETADVCPHFGRCGGCTYQSLDYSAQLELKEKQVKEILDNAINGEYQFDGIIGSPVNEHYRNKMEFSFGDEVKDGELALGLHKRNSTYDIVTVDGCRIIHDDFCKILMCTLEYFKERNVRYLHKLTHEGYLRHLLVRRAYKTGQILVDLVTTTQETHDLDGWKKALLNLSLEGEIAGILHTNNDSLADAVVNDSTELLYGKAYIEEELLGLKFKISPFSFFQTNSLGAEVLYSKAREYMGTTKDKVVFDLYSGTGTIAQILAPVAKKVVGVEIVKEAVDAAVENARLNGLTNCEFIADDVLKALDNIEDTPDLIMLDPPRDGINPKALSKIIDYGVNNIVYISCKPTSLARDLQMLQERGYRVKKACLIDLFPGTYHVESVVLLSQQKADDYLEVEIDLDELDATSAETKATYEEIKKYVAEHNDGMKVSNLYIAQVKKKCGIELGQNFNLPKSENAKQPQCPKEKEDAIVEALKAFQMI